MQPDDGDVLHLLGRVLHQAGDFTEAEKVIRRALQINPQSADLSCLLGEVLCNQGKPEEAASVLHEATVASPANAGLYFSLGNLLKQQAEFEPAAACYRKALERRPDFAEAHNNLANLLRATGEFDAALNHAKRAAELMPQHPGVRLTLGNAWFGAGDPQEAIAQYRVCLTLVPDFPEACISLGNVLCELGRYAEAVTYCRRAVELCPVSADAWMNLGNALRGLWRNPEAITCYEKALEINPSLASACTNLGQVYRDVGDHGLALEYGRRAIALDPSNAPALNNLGNALMTLGRLDEAIECYESALGLCPEMSCAYSNYLLCINYLRHYDAATILEKHLAFSRRYEMPLTGQLKPYPNDLSAGKRLKIGYVSADLRNHSVAYFIGPVLAAHDRKHYEIYCYYNHPKVDEYTRRFRSCADHWRTIADLPDAAVADRIREDGIDILVDLGGHTSGNRLLVFARKPAPLQLSWLGYLNTTGLSSMDYRITDARATPMGMLDHCYSEKLIRLPYCQWCYEPPTPCPEVGPLPALARGNVTFASFHALAKISGEIIDVWARLLARAPGSRLLLVAPGIELVADQLRQQFAGQGIDKSRIECLGKQPFPDYLALHNKVDINLDAYPYTGGTTTCHSLWMGVPVITLTGDTATSRGGASLLGVMGLDELIASTPEQYIDTAVALSANHARLASLRRELRSRMRGCRLTDGEAFTRTLEQEYRHAWQALCNG